MVVVAKAVRMEETREKRRREVRRRKNVFQSYFEIEVGGEAVALVEGVASRAVGEAVVDAWRQREGVKKEDGVVCGVLDCRNRDDARSGFCMIFVARIAGWRARDERLRREDCCGPRSFSQCTA